MDKHISFLGYAYLLFGILGLLLAGGIFFFFTGTAMLAGDQGAAFALTTAGTFIGIFFAVLSLPSFILGYGFLNYRSWSRPLGFVIACISLFHFPFGTALAIYTFWVLQDEESTRMLSD